MASESNDAAPIGRLFLQPLLAIRFRVSCSPYFLYPKHLNPQIYKPTYLLLVLLHSTIIASAPPKPA